MKKVLLVLFVFLLGGCFDYKEVNDLSFISAIGIDYDDEYNLTVEVLEDDENNTFLMSSKGDTLAKAFNNLGQESAKVPYFYHLKAVILDENTAKNKLKDVIDYILRAPDIRNEFTLVIAPDCKASDILNADKKYKLSIGDEIQKLVEINDYNYNISYAKPFENVLEKILNPNINAVTTVLELNDKKIQVKGIGIFDKYNYVNVLTKEDSSLLNVFLNEKSNYLISLDDVAIRLYDSHVDMNFDNSDVKITISGKGQIEQTYDYLNLKDDKSYELLSKKANDFLKEKANVLIHDTLEYDVIGIKDKYYKKYKKNIDKFNVVIESNVVVNKKGLIFDASKN